MPICNKIFAAMAGMALFATPAMADGKPGQRVNRGPAPLQAHAQRPPEPGCVLVEGGNAWSCPRPAPRYTTHQPTQRAHTTRTTSHGTHYGHRTNDHSHTHSHTKTHDHPHGQGHHERRATRTYTKTSAPTRTTRTYTRTAAPTVARRSSHTTTRRVAQPTRRTVRDTGLTLDAGSFSGGVGNGVDGGFYGGGGAIVLGGERRFSGVLSHSASAFTFRQRGTRGGKRGHHGGGGGCGC